MTRRIGLSAGLKLSAVFAILFAAPVLASAEGYRLTDAAFYPDLCFDARLPTLMDWPEGKTDTTTNGEGRDPSMVMDRAVRYHSKGVPVSLIQWQDPVWVPGLKRFRWAWEIIGTGSVLMSATLVENRNAVLGELRAIPSMDLGNVAAAELFEPKGPMPAYPQTFNIRIGAGDGGTCGYHPFVDYYFVLEE